MIRFSAPLLVMINRSKNTKMHKQEPSDLMTDLIIWLDEHVDTCFLVEKKNVSQNF